MQKMSSTCTYTKKNGKKPTNMHETITLAILCTRSFTCSTNSCYLFYPHEHKWDMVKEILDGSVLLRTSAFKSGVQPTVARRQGGPVSDMVKG